MVSVNPGGASGTRLKVSARKGPQEWSTESVKPDETVGVSVPVSVFTQKSVEASNVKVLVPHPSGPRRLGVRDRTSTGRGGTRRVSGGKHSQTQE